MATTVYTKEEIELSDGTPVTLKPANITTLRKFMKIMEQFGKVDNEEEGLDILVKAAALCLSGLVEGFWENDEPTEKANDTLDMPTIYKVLDVCGGVKLNDPNLLAAAAASLGQDGTN